MSSDKKTGNVARRGQGQGTKAAREAAEADDNFEQIEYLLHQSARGLHFMFENSEIARVLGTPADDHDFFTIDNMEKVQGLLSSLLDRPSMNEKRSYLDRLDRAEYELLLRAYFHLVENTILAHSNIRH